jgi:hypothetical protein
LAIRDADKSGQDHQISEPRVKAGERVDFEKLRLAMTIAADVHAP